MRAKLAICFIAMLGLQCSRSVQAALPGPEQVLLPQVRALPNCVYFVDMKDAVVAKQELTEWTEEEKSKVRVVLNMVALTRPKLLKAALSGTNLKLFRAHSGIDVSAQTMTDGIAFGDSFFRATKNFRYTTLLHELVHWTDSGMLIAFEPKFAKYAQPKIEDVACTRILFGEGAAKRRARALVSRLSMYGFTDLHEFLAESYVAAATADQTKLSWVVDQLESSNQNVVEFRTYFRTGQLLSQTEHLDGALLSFTKASKLAPEALGPHSALAACLKHKRSKAWQVEAALARRIAENAGIPKTDYYVSCLEDPQMVISRYVEGCTKADILPDQEMLGRNFEMPMITPEELALIGEILFNKHDPAWKIFQQLRDADLHSSQLAPKLEAYVSEQKSKSSHAVRGLWYAWVGQTRRAHYDFSFCLSSKDGDDSDARNMVSIYIQERRLREAEELQQRFEVTYPKSLSLRASKIKLLIAQGRIKEAKKVVQDYLKKMSPHFSEPDWVASQYSRPSN